MRFLSIYKSVEQNRPPTEEEMARMGALIEEYLRPAICWRRKAVCRPRSARAFAWPTGR